MRKRIHQFGVLILVAVVSVIPRLEAAETNATLRPDYLTIVKDYADAMIKEGRDTYGKEHSPLFAAALNRKTMKIGAFPDIPGVRNGDRSLGGANPQTEYGLYKILYRLTELTGDKNYAEEADKALKFFFTHCQSPNTGLMTWGEHIFWDFNLENVGGKNSIHEINGKWPFWDQCYMLASEACWKFAIGLWDHQIANKKTGNFSRHAKWSDHGPGIGADFPRYAGQMIEIWTDAYERKENANRERRSELVTAIAVIVGRMESNMKSSKTGYLLAGTDKNHRRIVWPGSNLELARCLWEAAPHMDGELARRMKKLALQQDIHFHEMPHMITSGGGFAGTIDSVTGQPRSRSMNKPYTAVWATGYGYGIHSGMANKCYIRYLQLEEDHSGLALKYKKLILAAADQYLTAIPDSNRLQKPGALASVITLMMNAHQLTGKKKYIDRADEFGRLSVKLFLDDGLPLPRATNKHEHYETITGGPGFMNVLLKLHEALSMASREN